MNGKTGKNKTIPIYDGNKRKGGLQRLVSTLFRPGCFTQVISLILTTIF